jgi:FAD/FMN-containing dehydrogenase
MSELASGLSEVIGDPSRILTQPQIVERLSRDFYWYSPILKAQLDDKRADIVVQPISLDEIVATLRYCHAHDIPVTARGAGTGNYGQAVPLQGGVVLDLQLMDKIEAFDLSADGTDCVAVCQPGMKLGALETAARELGWELRCYPSTVAKSSLGGFLGGGSGGIGSISHGGLRDFQTVRAIEVVTMEAEPRVIKHEGQAVHEIMHSWGTNGVITRIWFALTPAVQWGQVAVTFPTFAAAFDLSETVAKHPGWQKRLITVFEWPIPSFFGPVKQLAVDGHASIFFMIAESQRAALEQAAIAAGGTIQLSAAWTGLRSQPLLSDYTWNHTTLWAMKANPEYTYLQCGYDPERAREQFALLKDKYGDDFLQHIEWTRAGTGVITPGSIPIVRYSTPERLNEMIDFCRSIGVGVANPHVNFVEGGGRFRDDNVQLKAKYKYDPKGLMNPGKMASFVPVAVPAASANEASEEVSA